MTFFDKISFGRFALFRSPLYPLGTNRRVVTEPKSSSPVSIPPLSRHVSLERAVPVRPPLPSLNETLTTVVLTVYLTPDEVLNVRPLPVLSVSWDLSV